MVTIINMGNLLPQGLRPRRIVVAFWVMALVAATVWAMFGSGWDVAVYRDAMTSLSAGRDPYVDAMARQNAYHRAELAHLETTSLVPFSYVYPPITISVLSAITMAPPLLSGVMYWSAYAVCAILVVWAGMQFVEREELKYFAYFAPMVSFFQLCS